MLKRRLSFVIIVWCLLNLLNFTLSCANFNWNPLYNWHERHVVALILARGGSKGIPLKNLSLINNRTLLEYSLDAIKRTARFTSIWISTENDLIANNVINASDVNVHWRSYESATDEATSIDAVKEFLKYHKYVDVIALIQCTSPFIRTEYLKIALNHINSGYDCVFTVTRSYKLRWTIINDKLYPINFDIKRRPRRQDWNGELIENGMFYIASTNLLLTGYFQNQS